MMPRSRKTLRPTERFLDAFSEELGRWSARVILVGLTIALGLGVHL